MATTPLETGPLRVKERRRSGTYAPLEDLGSSKTTKTRLSIVESSEDGVFMSDPRVRLITGTTHPALAASVAQRVGIPLTQRICGQFSNGEIRVEIAETCRGAHAFILQPICASADGKTSVNDSLMEVLLMCGALRSSSAKQITAVLPIYGYARQDKSDNRRAAISARVVADMLQSAGCTRVITIELHAGQIQGFFHRPVDNLPATKPMVAHINNKFRGHEKNLIVVSPDSGGAKRATHLSNILDTGCAIISKERSGPNVVDNMTLVGNVKGKICIIVDDMADTCGTLVKAAQLLLDEGAQEAHAYVCHGVFSGDAMKRLNESRIKSIVCTNSLPQNKNQELCKKLEIIDISGLLADAIRLVSFNRSLTSNL